MKTIAGISTGFMLALILASCGGYRHIYTNYDKSVDFTKYETFAWAPDSGAATIKNEFENTPYDNDIVRNNAKNYITYSLGLRGYLVDVDSPDFVLQLALLNEKKEKIVTYQARPYPSYYYYSPYYFPYYYPYYRHYTWYGWGYPTYWDEPATSYTQTYVKGTITINMYDRKLMKLVWTGSAEGNIYDPDYVRYDAHPAIDRIMKRFPVKPLQKPRRQEEWLLKERTVWINHKENDMMLPEQKVSGKWK